MALRCALLGTGSTREPRWDWFQAVARLSVYGSAGQLRFTSGGIMLFGQLALIVAAVFTGAAIYINVAEQPARLSSTMLRCWPSGSQPTSAALPCRRRWRSSAALRLVAWWQTAQFGFLAGAVLMIANWPWTLLGIMPTNKAIEAAPSGTPETRALIVKWNGLHAVRTWPWGLGDSRIPWGSASI